MFDTVINLCWYEGKRVVKVGFRFPTNEFPTKDQILEETKKHSEEAWRRLNGILYLINLDWSKRCPYGLLKNVPIEDDYNSSIFITEK